MASTSITQAGQQHDSYTVATEADDIVTRVLFDAISEEFNIPIHYKDFSSFDAILDSVAQGTSDFAANVTHTEQRSSIFEYSRPTNIEYTFLFSETGKNLDEVTTVGVPKDTIYGNLVLSHFPGINIVEYQGHDEAKLLLQSHQVEGVVDAINQLKPMLMAGFNSQLLNNQLTIKPVSIIAKKGEHVADLTRFTDFIYSEGVQRLLRETVNQYQYDLRRNSIRERVAMSGIDTSQPLKVKLENIYPYAQFDASGLPYGISAEVIFEACDILTLKCEVVNEPNETWESMYQDFLNQDIDIIAPLVISQSRRKIANFTSSHYSPQSILVKRIGYKDRVYQNISELISERIGVVKDDFFDELLSLLLPNKSLHYYNSNAELIDALLNEEVDYIAYSLAGLSHVFREQGLLPITPAQSIGSIYQSQIAIGLIKNEKGALLAPLFDKALAMIDTERINHKYDQLPDWRETLEAEQQLSRRSQGLFIIVLGFMLVTTILLNKQAHTDSLTKLRNRRSLQRKYRRKVKPWHAVVSLDINHFKQINDTYGHEVGDLVLQQYANVISTYWRGYGYRVGGDEFVLIGEASGSDLDTIIEQLSEFMFISEKHSLYLSITVSVGVSENRNEDKHLSEVLAKTDSAMYQSKRDIGRKCTFVDEQGKCGKVYNRSAEKSTQKSA
ncbi:transporter substrate-binding domain-containing protein [Vibrio sp. 99-70-13A1]|nr:GGDEF domain-containing protein [Vibrio sp. 99-70-13A1]NOH99050.1 transporter substrate-binding domain-containing protein [Vibrio sp. 99-70-13A1]